MNDCAGLTWAPEGFWEEMRPQRAVEPDIDIITTIERRELQVPNDSTFSVEFLAKERFNKVYTVHCDGKDDFIMRVSLPVQPRLKTLSEHATIDYIRQHTDLPVPQIFTSEAKNGTELGFEWMIMQRIPGTNLREQWRHMIWIKKELLVRKVVEYQVQVFRKRFRQAGNIYTTSKLQALSTANIPDTTLLGVEHSSDSFQYCLGQIVSIHPSSRFQIAAVEVDNQPVWSNYDEEEGSEEDSHAEMQSDTDVATDTATDSTNVADVPPTACTDTEHEDNNMEDSKEEEDYDDDGEGLQKDDLKDEPACSGH